MMQQDEYKDSSGRGIQAWTRRSITLASLVSDMHVALTVHPWTRVNGCFIHIYGRPSRVAKHYPVEIFLRYLY